MAKRAASQKRDASGNYVDANPNATAQTPKYTLEQWHTITHDVELEMHPETLLLKEGVELSEDEINELRRQRRMERQPELSAELDQIVIWLHDILKKKGRKTIQEIVRAVHNRETRIAKSFDVLFQMWPLCANRNSVVEALVCSRPLMFYCVITRPTHIPDALSKEDLERCADVVTYVSLGDYVPLISDECVASWVRAAPFFDKTWKDVGISTAMVYHIATRSKWACSLCTTTL